jgi:hypothetical protein
VIQTARSVLIAVAALGLLATGADVRAQDSELREQLEALESWIVLEEEAAPEPPLLRAHLGVAGWLEVRTRIQQDGDGVSGSRLDDLEANQGLATGGAAPWFEVTLGAKVRGGADGMYFFRNGDFRTQDDDVVFEGETIAREGDLLETEFAFTTLGGFVEWDAIYGRNYRIGLVGGVRYFRFDLRFRVRDGGRLETTETRGELLSPYFGGLVELTPFPYLTVFARAQFMNWSWEEINLKEARYFELRLGATLNVIPGLLGIGAEYRFVSSQAEADDGPDRIRVGLGASGLAFTLNLSF